MPTFVKSSANYSHMKLKIIRLKLLLFYFNNLFKKSPFEYLHMHLPKIVFRKRASIKEMKQMSIEWLV